jgi:O-antigen/teichoic acid export membrane protein
MGWIAGEIFEAKIFGSFGLLTIMCSLMLFMFGNTPNAKALPIPLFIVGIFFLSTAIVNISNNKQRLHHSIDAFNQDQSAFIEQERKRVENFQYLYRMTIAIASISFILAICFFIFTDNYILKAIGIALTIFGLTGLVIDYFSKERADKYYREITNELERHYR